MSNKFALIVSGVNGDIFILRYVAVSHGLTIYNLTRNTKAYIISDLQKYCSDRFAADHQIFEITLNQYMTLLNSEDLESDYTRIYDSKLERVLNLADFIGFNKPADNREVAPKLPIPHTCRYGVYVDDKSLDLYLMVYGIHQSQAFNLTQRMFDEKFDTHRVYAIMHWFPTDNEKTMLDSPNLAWLASDDVYTLLRHYFNRDTDALKAHLKEIGIGGFNIDGTLSMTNSIYVKSEDGDQDIYYHFNFAALSITTLDRDNELVPVTREFIPLIEEEINKRYPLLGGTTVFIDCDEYLRATQ